jgi:drug/metabolite transporter (DMT)-like permease
MERVPYIGEIFSLSTALIWAVAVILFRRSGERVHPVALNLFKNTLSMVLILPTMWIIGQTLFLKAPISEYLLLMLSGAIGIAVGDTLFFKSLNQIGAGLTAIVVCLYSPFIIGLSVVLLGDRLSVLQMLGALMVVIAVLSTIKRGAIRKVPRKDLLQGILWGVLATACMAVGIVMIKPVLTRSPLLWATEVRLFGAVPALGLVVAIHPLRKKVISSLGSPGSWRFTISGSIIGAYAAMVVWLAGMKYAPVSIASALNQTSTVFVVILAAIFLKEPLTPRRLVAIALAFAGVLLVGLG